ncbi:uncharacterized protein EV422DRAFT_505798 [Fimicolochytrium jonesii]|uniref:uncharacterized protein n=1 Tax=Fimicolochytrium jonesii TaxID=1396493 RepID=UPI0022FF20D9|nr:uncharacterized protein EV422DRAFT_505798 [Fimicolochytrium jonesii]KAI8821678.1 hypothetical protein EV422DRAFT_505798 [Fimicolochytrium jonesii]
MSEYWVSNKKHYYNKISRQNHDGGRKHKENIANYLRDVHKRQEEKNAVDAETKAMLEKIEQAWLSLPSTLSFSSRLTQRLSQAAGKQYARDTQGPSTLALTPEAAAAARRQSQKDAATNSAVATVLENLNKKSQEASSIKNKTEKDDTESHPYGDWETIAIHPPPPPSSTATGGDDKKEQVSEFVGNSWADDGDEEPEQNLKEFKLKEKMIQDNGDLFATDGLATGSAAPVFKKRKLGAAMKGNRNVRKRED